VTSDAIWHVEAALLPLKRADHVCNVSRFYAIKLVKERLITMAKSKGVFWGMKHETTAAILSGSAGGVTFALLEWSRCRALSAKVSVKALM